MHSFALGVYDLSGRLMRALINGERVPGTYPAVWDGTDGIGDQMEGGVYFYRLSVGSRTTTKRMLLVR